MNLHLVCKTCGEDYHVSLKHTRHHTIPLNNDERVISGYDYTCDCTNCGDEFICRIVANDTMVNNKVYHKNGYIFSAKMINYSDVKQFVHGFSQINDNFTINTCGIDMEFNVDENCFFSNEINQEFIDNSLKKTKRILDNSLFY